MSKDVIKKEEEHFIVTLDRIAHRRKVGGVIDGIKKKARGAAAVLQLDDYKDTWTLIHGKKPVLDENYLYFQQIDDALNQHPNFLHFQIKQFLEEFDYVIINDVKPLPDEIRLKDNEHIIFNFTGYLSASIECKREKLKGHTRIYLKEEGICHFSSQFAPPFVKGNIRLVFAGTVENMSSNELKTDILGLKEKINDILNTEVTF
ncbi:MAG: hypothetical protein ACTSO9_02660 [Candidatus Helarchaeota archaeon]